MSETAVHAPMVGVRDHLPLQALELMDAFPQLLWIVSPGGVCQWFNQPWRDFTHDHVRPGMTIADLSDFIHPDDRLAFTGAWHRAEKSAGLFECQCRIREASDGEYRWHLARANPRRDSHGIIATWHASATDIHALTQATSAAEAVAVNDMARLDLRARQSDQRLSRQVDFTRGITDSLALGLYAVDLHGHATFVNPAAEQMLGYQAGDLTGREMHGIIHYQHEDHSDFPQEQCPLLAVLRTGKLVRVDDDVFTRRDGSFLPVSYSSAPVLDGETVVGAVISFQDITHRKEAEAALKQYNENLEKRVVERTAELREINTRLHSSNRELQDFASVASHDLQEPLRKIQAFGDRLATRAGPSLGPDGADYLRRMKNAAGRMQTLINDLLSFARVTTKAQPFSSVNLREIADEVLLDLESAIEKNDGRVEFGKLPMIDADPLQMRQLFQNLIGNALKFRRPNVRSIIRIYSRMSQTPREETISANAASDNVAISPGEMCEIAIEDNGIGFDEKYLDRIFNVFQRLHGRTEYEGTGIGLAVCRKIAERHGGTITARSVEGAGSTFLVALPLHHENPITPSSAIEE